MRSPCRRLVIEKAQIDEATSTIRASLIAFLASEWTGDIIALSPPLPGDRNRESWGFSRSRRMKSAR
jgi:hypothetical protein